MQLAVHRIHGALHRCFVSIMSVPSRLVYVSLLDYRHALQENSTLCSAAERGHEGFEFVHALHASSILVP
jgi:hypothetical protein